MKTTEFLNRPTNESYDSAEYNDEVGMVKNNLHTLVRNAVELAKGLKNNENVPEWVQEKIAKAKGMIVAANEYLTSQHSMGVQPEVPDFDSKVAEAVFTEAVMGGAVPGGPRNGEDYAFKLRDLRDRIASAPDVSTREHLKIALNDLQRVALQRGIIDAQGKIIKENATAGASSAGAVAVSMEQLGGAITRQGVAKKLKTYNNVRTAGGPVKIKKAKQ